MYRRYETVVVSISVASAFHSRRWASDPGRQSFRARERIIRSAWVVFPSRSTLVYSRLQKERWERGARPC